MTIQYCPLKYGPVVAAAVQLAALASLAACGGAPDAAQQAPQLAAQTAPSLTAAGTVEMAGNAFITQSADGASIGGAGLVDWSSPATVASA